MKTKQEIPEHKVKYDLDVNTIILNGKKYYSDDRPKDKVTLSGN